MQGNAANETEVVVAAVLAKKPQRESLLLNTALNRETEQNIFNALVSSDIIKCIVIAQGADVISIEDILRTTVESMPNLRQMFMVSSFTESQVNRLFTILQTSSTLCQMVIYLGDCTEEIANPLAKYLGEGSSLGYLLLMGRMSSRENQNVPLSGSTCRTICKGICESRSLRSVGVCVPPVTDDADIVAESLAIAITKSASLRKVGLDMDFSPDFPSSKVHNA